MSAPERTAVDPTCGPALDPVDGWAGHLNRLLSLSVAERAASREL